MTRPWLQTLTGRQWFVDEPEAYAYDIVEIARALAHLNRFAGHTTLPYSVAQHSVFVAEEVMRATAVRRLAKAALIHDAAEAFCVDLPAPIKRMKELAGYRAIIRRTEVAIARSFGVEDLRKHPAIARADLVALATEKRDVLGPSPHDDDWGLDLPPPSEARIVPSSHDVACGVFLRAWSEYSKRGIT